MTGVSTTRPVFVTFTGVLAAPLLRLLLINRTTFLLRTRAFLSFGGLLAFAKGSFKALNAIISPFS